MQRSLFSCSRAAFLPLLSVTCSSWLILLNVNTKHKIVSCIFCKMWKQRLLCYAVYLSNRVDYAVDTYRCEYLPAAAVLCLMWYHSIYAADLDLECSDVTDIKAIHTAMVISSKYFFIFELRVSQSWTSRTNLLWLLSEIQVHKKITNCRKITGSNPYWTRPFCVEFEWSPRVFTGLSTGSHTPTIVSYLLALMLFAMQISTVCTRLHQKRMENINDHCTWHAAGTMALQRLL